MGIRIITTALIVILSVSCKSQEVIVQRDELQNKKEWTWAFKSRVTYTCMCELTNNDLHDLLKKHQDISFMGEADVLGVRYTNFADSVGRTFARKITPVFPDDSEFAGRKSIFTSCLALYNNKEISAIIEEEYDRLK